MAGEIHESLNLFDWEWIKQLMAPGALIASIAAAYRVGGRAKDLEGKIASVEKEATQNTIDIKSLKLKAEELQRDHGMLAVAVAALPTRDEMDRGFESVRQEIRNLRRDA